VDKRRYGQFCGIAFALDLVGERWTMLIIRDLVLGPRRFKDLLDGLPGIATNLLAQRLRELEANGLVERVTLPPPAASTVYELTEYGRELEEPLYALARWGARSLPPPDEDEDFYPDWGLNAFAALLDPHAARGLTATYVVRVADDVYTVRLEDSTVHVEVGATDEADLDFATDRETFFGLASRELDPRSAVSGGAVDIGTGKPADLERFFSVFNFTQRAQVAV